MESEEGEMMTDEDFLNAMEQMAINEETDVEGLLKAMNENQMISWEEAERILADTSNEPIKSSLPEQTRPTEPDNETNVDRCIQQLLENDPNLKQINLNNMKRTPIPQLKRLIEAMAYNEHVEKLSLANLGLYDHDMQVLVEAIKLNQSLKHLNLETNYLSGEFFSKVFEAALVNQTIEELKAVNQGVSFSTQAEKEIINMIQQNHGLCKISLTLRLPEGRHKIEQTTLRNGEIRRLMRRKQREEEEAKKKAEGKKEPELPVEPVKAKLPPKKITPITAPPPRAPLILAAPDDVKKVARLPMRRESFVVPDNVPLEVEKEEKVKESIPRAIPEPEKDTELVKEPPKPIPKMKTTTVPWRKKAEVVEPELPKPEEKPIPKIKMTALPWRRSATLQETVDVSTQEKDVKKSEITMIAKNKTSESVKAAVLNGVSGMSKVTKGENMEMKEKGMVEPKEIKKEEAVTVSTINNLCPETSTSRSEETQSTGIPPMILAEPVPQSTKDVGTIQKSPSPHSESLKENAPIPPVRSFQRVDNPLAAKIKEETTALAERKKKLSESKQESIATKTPTTTVKPRSAASSRIGYAMSRLQEKAVEPPKRPVVPLRKTVKESEEVKQEKIQTEKKEEESAKGEDGSGVKEEKNRLTVTKTTRKAKSPSPSVSKSPMRIKKETEGKEEDKKERKPLNADKIALRKSKSPSPITVKTNANSEEKKKGTTTETQGSKNRVPDRTKKQIVAPTVPERPSRTVSSRLDYARARLMQKAEGEGTKVNTPSGRLPSKSWQKKKEVVDTVKPKDTVTSSTFTPSNEKITDIGNTSEVSKEEIVNERTTEVSENTSEKSELKEGILIDDKPSTTNGTERKETGEVSRSSKSKSPSPVDSKSAYSKRLPSSTIPKPSPRLRNRPPLKAT